MEDDSEKRNIDVPFQDYIDARFAEITRAVDLARAASKGEAVPLREFFDAVLDEQRRGMIVAEQERQKAAQALAEEREKTAQALAISLGTQIKQGDESLRDHIQNQVAQIRDALTAAQRLSEEQHRTTSGRIDDTVQLGRERLDGLRRELTLIQEASADAISKAEAANEKRFEAVNEFRGQLSDQTSSFIRREVADAQFDELRRQIADLTAKIAQIA